MSQVETLNSRFLYSAPSSGFILEIRAFKYFIIMIVAVVVVVIIYVHALQHLFQAIWRV